HGSHGIHPQAVHVVLVEPEVRAAAEKIAYLGASIVEYGAAPLGVKALSWIGVLVKMRAIEVTEPMLVRREVRGDPVEDHADAAPVQVVDEVHEVLRRA